jgi:hypothetical protein
MYPARLPQVTGTHPLCVGPVTGTVAPPRTVVMIVPLGETRQYTLPVPTLMTVPVMPDGGTVVVPSSTRR